MRCKQAGRMMSARLDGHIDQKEASRLRDHMASCGPCQIKWQKMEALDRLLRSAPIWDAPPHLHIRVTSRIERRERARRTVVGGTALVVGVTTLALLVFVPFALGLLDNLGIGPALVTGGLETITQLLVLFHALSRTLAILLDQFTVPLAILGAGSLLMALTLSGLWVVTIRKLRVVR